MRKNSVAGTVTLILCLAGLALVPVADARIRGCGFAAGYFVKANLYTSCPFARNVARGFAHGDYSPTAYSPSTGRYITMRCRGGYRSAYCTGGNHAFVSLRR